MPNLASLNSTWSSVLGNHAECDLNDNVTRLRGNFTGAVNDAAKEHLGHKKKQRTDWISS